MSTQNPAPHRHQGNKERNTARMFAEQIPFQPSNNDENLLVRQPWASVDFYPSTGKFRDVISGEVYDHTDFFEWYRKRKAKYVPPPPPKQHQGTGSRRRIYVRRAK